MTAISTLVKQGAVSLDVLNSINDNFSNVVQISPSSDQLVAGVLGSSGDIKTLVALSGATDAVDPHTAANYEVATAGVDAMTLAAPTAGTDDGKVIRITSAGAHAHTLTATGLLQTGSASVNVATFAADAGAGLTLMAYNAKWQVLSQIGITFS